MFRYFSLFLKLSFSTNIFLGRVGILLFILFVQRSTFSLTLTRGDCKPPAYGVFPKKISGVTSGGGSQIFFFRCHLQGGPNFFFSKFFFSKFFFSIYFFFLSCSVDIQLARIQRQVPLHSAHGPEEKCKISTGKHCRRVNGAARLSLESVSDQAVSDCWTLCNLVWGYSAYYQPYTRPTKIPQHEITDEIDQNPK